MTKVKICGITNYDDAIYASECGADALGFVFYKKSPRYINPADAQAIIKKLPPFIQSVGLFVNHTKDEINQINHLVDLNLFQFHGDEDPLFCQSLSHPFIKAIRVKDKNDIINAFSNFQLAKAILVDKFSNHTYGGTGESFDWSLIPKNHQKPMILAGGLNCNNITKAINETNPYAVDVSSGVELSKGKKDPQLIKKFITCAKLSIV